MAVDKARDFVSARRGKIRIELTIEPKMVERARKEVVRNV